MKKLLLVFFACIFIFSCTRFSDAPTDAVIQAYAPIYISTINARQISIEAPRSVAKAGKIFVFGNFLFENDINTGIHVIDISDRSKPKKISFINIPLSTEVAVKGNYLYTNNYSDLLTFNIIDPEHPVLVKRSPDVFPLPNQNYPPYNNVAFECVDPAKGVVAGWELKQIRQPKCRR